MTSVTALSYYDSNNTLQTASGYEIDATATPVRIWFTGTVPTTSSTKSPVGYVDYVAGWASASVVPEGVKLAIKLLAAHYYEHRSDASDGGLSPVPFGFAAVCDQFRTGLQGYYGEAR